MMPGSYLVNADATKVLLADKINHYGDITSYSKLYDISGSSSTKKRIRTKDMKSDVTMTKKLAGVYMTNIELTRNELITSISLALPSIIEELVNHSETFKELDVSKLSKKILFLAKNAPADILISLNSEELKHRTEKIMVTESMILAFKELTLEERDILD